MDIDSIVVLACLLGLAGWDVPEGPPETALDFHGVRTTYRDFPLPMA